jgi:hypothetical protein
MITSIFKKKRPKPWFVTVLANLIAVWAIYKIANWFMNMARKQETADINRKNKSKSKSKD